MENNPLFNAGKGAVFNIAGQNELEASVAVSKPPDGVSLPVSRRGAAVTLLKHVKNPILLAKELYLDQDKCPHPFVSGADAERIAEEKGMELVDEKYFYTDGRWQEHRRGLGLPDEALTSTSDGPPVYTGPLDLPELSKGTVGAVALDANGMLAVATSTGGKTNKNVGRIGDTPSMGSGFWSSSWPVEPSFLERIGLRFFSTPKSQGVAISGTGDGDYYIRNAATYDVASRMMYLKEPVAKAAERVMQFLKTQKGAGGMIAVDELGNYAMPINCSCMFRGVITPETSVARVAIWATDDLEEIK
ncbi:MAG: hypothetical protein CYPHOPRED_001319 [Cyphobasidiales sp. Tagirdzhanova-0007]|nr:MAG: hypothetical protein CYPHOPRED_001319 [Cyphobasidiales sp. Tagirdzhanova-0007]